MRYNAGVDKSGKRLRRTRSAFAPETLRAVLAKVHTKEVGRQHRQGYLRKPVRRGEFSVWEAEQVWLD